MGNYWNPVELTDRHREALRLVVLGNTHAAVAKLLGFRWANSVTRIVNSRKGQEYLAELRLERNRAFVEGAIRRSMGRF
jgi:hypothetical protein